MSKYYKEIFRESFKSEEAFQQWIASLNNEKRRVVSYQRFTTLYPNKIVVEFALLEA